MESFFRYIAYVDYYKNGERISNVGFLKWRFFHKEHEVEIKINGLPKIKKNCSIKEIGSGKEIGILLFWLFLFFLPQKSRTGVDFLRWILYNGFEKRKQTPKPQRRKNI